jgi:hypothetical protein
MEGIKVVNSFRCRGVGRQLDIDWEIMNEQGSVIQRGVYSDQVYSGVEATLGKYVPNLKSHLRVLLRIHTDVQGFDSAHLKLELQADPEYRLDNGYASAAFLVWAAIVAGSGVIILLVLLIITAARKNAWTSPS